MRTIEFSKSEKFDNVNEGNDVNVNKVVGYLIQWAMHNTRYSKLVLYGSGDGCLNATYRDKDGNVTYNIFAERGEDGTFSTHS